MEVIQGYTYYNCYGLIECENKQTYRICIEPDEEAEDKTACDLRQQ